MEKLLPQLALIEDVDSIMDIFIACTDAMVAAGIHQWNYTYPTPKVVTQDIRKQEAYVFKEGEKCLATITLNTDQDKQYENINWSFPSDKVFVIHRLAVHPQAQGRGFGKQLCLLAEQVAQEQGCEVIRLDAYSENTISNQLYLRLGYQIADGYCYFHGNDIPFKCFEKRL